MIRISRSDFKKLYQSPSYTGLHEKITSIAKSEGDVIAFDETSLNQAFARLLEAWLNTGIKFTRTFEPTDALARQQQAARKQAEEQAKVIEQAAQARVVHYIREEGLLADADDPDNCNYNLVMGWFERNRAQFTAYNVDLAITQLAGQLRWAVWSPRLQPVEEVRTLENGEPELPLTASPDEIRRASKAQVDDLSRRKGEFTAHRRGRFGASFIKSTF